MSIREKSLKIASYLFEKAVEYGTFKNSYPATYGELGDALGMSPKECRLCCEYLESIGCVNVTTNPDGNGTDLLFKAMPAVVDFLENTPS